MTKEVLLWMMLVMGGYGGVGVVGWDPSAANDHTVRTTDSTKDNGTAQTNPGIVNPETVQTGTDTGMVVR
jgi:hypothetical protein